MTFEVQEEKHGLDGKRPEVRELPAEVAGSPFLSSDAKSKLRDALNGERSSSKIAVECECTSPGQITYERARQWLDSVGQVRKKLQETGIPFKEGDVHGDAGGRETFAVEFQITKDDEREQRDGQRDAKLHRGRREIQEKTQSRLRQLRREILGR